MPPDQNSIPLPEPPPPRPAARDAAIEAALRRFDGAEDPPQAAPPGTRWNRNPVWGLAMAASLVAVIGLPAAFIALRNQVSSPTSVQEPAPPKPSRSAPTSLAPAAQPAPASINGAILAPPGAPPTWLQRNEVEVPSTAAIAPVAEAGATPESGLAYAAPPPPPPAAPAPMAQKSASESREIAVTGSRIPQPNISAETSDSLNSLPASGALAEIGGSEEPYRFVGNRSYADFMMRLQAAVRTNDQATVIGLIDFPLRVYSNGRRRLYQDAASVRANYGRIFTPKVKRAILNQRTDLFFGSDRGVMIGNGEAWFDQECPNTACSPPGPVRIKSINL